MVLSTRSLILYLSIFIIRLNAQSCYVEIENMSGFLTSNFSTELELESCRLIDSVPNLNQSNFKVLDFSYYIFSKSANQLNEIQSKVILDASNQYDGFLLFLKKSNPANIFERIDIEIAIPRQLLSECFSDLKISAIESSIKLKMNQIQYSGNPFDYVSFEVLCIKLLKNELLKLSDCCYDPSFNDDTCSNCILPDDIDDFFRNEEFDSISVNSLVESNEIDSCFCNGLETFSRNPSTVNYLVEINGELIDLSEKIYRLRSLFENASIMLTSNSSYCEDGFNENKQSFDNSPTSIWTHLSNNKIYFKTKGIGDNWKIGSCSQSYEQKLNCVLDRFIESGANIFTEILNSFDAQKKTLVINVDCPPGDTTAQGQTIDKYLGRLGIVDIYINPSQFEIASDYPLKMPATLLHEGCHALASLKVFESGGPNNCNWLNYNYYFNSYGNVGQTDECIIARHFIEKQAKLLWIYNNKHLEMQNYLSSAWGPYFYSYGSCNMEVDYTISEISDLYIEMRDSNPNPFPCLDVE